MLKFSLAFSQYFESFKYNHIHELFHPSLLHYFKHGQHKLKSYLAAEVHAGQVLHTVPTSQTGVLRR